MDNLKFEDLPQTVAKLYQQVNKNNHLLKQLVNSPGKEQPQWLNIKQLCVYLPDKPSIQTVYGWVNKRLIPFHKKGKKLYFLKNQIDEWLIDGKKKTKTEIREQALTNLKSKGGSNA